MSNITIDLGVVYVIFGAMWFTYGLFTTGTKFESKFSLGLLKWSRIILCTYSIMIALITLAVLFKVLFAVVL